MCARAVSTPHASVPLCVAEPPTTSTAALPDDAPRSSAVPRFVLCAVEADPGSTLSVLSALTSLLHTAGALPPPRRDELAACVLAVARSNISAISCSRDLRDSADADGGVTSLRSSLVSLMSAVLSLAVDRDAASADAAVECMAHALPVLLAVPGCMEAVLPLCLRSAATVDVVVRVLSHDSVSSALLSAVVSSREAASLMTRLQDMIASASLRGVASDSSDGDRGREGGGGGDAVASDGVDASAAALPQLTKLFLLLLRHSVSVVSQRSDTDFSDVESDVTDGTSDDGGGEGDTADPSASVMRRSLGSSMSAVVSMAEDVLKAVVSTGRGVDVSAMSQAVLDGAVGSLLPAVVSGPHPLSSIVACSVLADACALTARIAVVARAHRSCCSRCVSAPTAPPTCRPQTGVRRC